MTLDESKLCSSETVHVLSVIIPAYNEVQTIGQALGKARSRPARPGTRGFRTSGRGCGSRSEGRLIRCHRRPRLPPPAIKLIATQPVPQGDHARHAPGARPSVTIAAFSAVLHRRRRGVSVKTSTRRKLCPSIGKLLGKRTPCLDPTREHQSIAITACKARIALRLRSAANLALLKRRGLRPQFQRKKPWEEDAGPHRPRQCDPRSSEVWGRARLCRPEMSAWARHSHGWHWCALGQSGLQLHPGWPGSVDKPRLPDGKAHQRPPETSNTALP
jgi:hypothetical protein